MKSPVMTFVRCLLLIHISIIPSNKSASILLFYHALNAYDQLYEFKCSDRSRWGFWPSLWEECVSLWTYILCMYKLLPYKQGQVKLPSKTHRRNRYSVM